MSTNPLENDLKSSLLLTEDLFEELRGRSIFITGGTGFFGSWLLEMLCFANETLNLNFQIHTLSRNPDKLSDRLSHLANKTFITFHKGDVRNFEFPKGKFTHIIHAATEASAKLLNEKPELMFDTIINGTKRTLEFASKCGAEKFLFTSSGAVYGKQPPEITHIEESFKGSPDLDKIGAAYGEGKRAAELLCRIYSDKYGFEAKIARCFAFVGPYMDMNSHFAISDFIRDAVRGGPIEIKDDGTSTGSYMYASDLAVWLLVILFNGRNCRPYNVGSEEEITTLGLAEKVRAAFSGKVAISRSKTSTQGKNPGRYVPSTKLAEMELGLRLTVTLEDAIKKTIEWNLVQSYLK